MLHNMRTLARLITDRPFGWDPNACRHKCRDILMQMFCVHAHAVHYPIRVTPNALRVFCFCIFIQGIMPGAPRARDIRRNAEDRVNIHLLWYWLKIKHSQCLPFLLFTTSHNHF